MMHLTQPFNQQLDQSYAQGGIQAAEQFLLSHIASPHNEYSLVAAYNELGSLYRGTSRLKESMDSFEQAETLAARLYGKQRSEYATILNNMAGTCRLAQDHDRAVSLFKQAIAIYAGAGEDNGYLYASVWNNLALAYRDSGRSHDAIRCLDQALSIMKELPGYSQELAITHNNLAVLLHSSGDQEGAAFHLSRAMEEFDACSDEENVHYAAGLNSLASFLYTTGDFPRALEAFEKSAQYTMRFFGKNLEYALTYQNMSRVCEALGDYSQAISALQTARDLYSDLLGTNHPRTLTATSELEQLRREADL